ncbi:gamma-crystallin 1-like [Synchiropus picturatus]
MVYERPGFSGYQYFLKKGEYPDYQKWMGFNDCLRSCRMIPKVTLHLLSDKSQEFPLHSASSSATQLQGSHKMLLYERPEFRGQMMELAEDRASLQERVHFHDIYSCNVLDGNWIFYEHPNYRGRQYLVRPGEYKRFNDWGSMSPRVGSIRRITM